MAFEVLEGGAQPDAIQYDLFSVNGGGLLPLDQSLAFVNYLFSQEDAQSIVIVRHKVEQTIRVVE